MLTHTINEWHYIYTYVNIICICIYIIYIHTHTMIDSLTLTSVHRTSSKMKNRLATTKMRYLWDEISLGVMRSLGCYESPWKWFLRPLTITTGNFLSRRFNFFYFFSFTLYFFFPFSFFFFSFYLFFIFQVSIIYLCLIAGHFAYYTDV